MRGTINLSAPSSTHFSCRGAVLESHTTWSLYQESSCFMAYSLGSICCGRSVDSVDRKARLTSADCSAYKAMIPLFDDWRSLNATFSGTSRMYHTFQNLVRRLVMAQTLELANTLLSLRSLFKYGHFPPKASDVGILYTEQRANYLLFLPYMLSLVLHLPPGIPVYFAEIVSSSKAPQETAWPRGKD